MLNTLYRFSVPQAVPLEGGATVDEIATATGLGEEVLSRIIKYACSHHIFREVSQGSSSSSSCPSNASHHRQRIVHTASSRAFLEHRPLQDSLAVCLDERFQRMPLMVPVRKSPGSTTTNKHLSQNGSDESSTSYTTETAFQAAFHTNDDFLAHLRDPANSQVNSAMNGFLSYVLGATNMGARNHDVDMLAGPAFDWDALGDAVVADVGLQIPMIDLPVDMCDPPG